jgi:hypothetical protein
MERLRHVFLEAWWMAAGAEGTTSGRALVEVRKGR